MEAAETMSAPAIVPVSLVTEAMSLEVLAATLVMLALLLTVCVCVSTVAKSSTYVIFIAEVFDN